MTVLLTVERDPDRHAWIARHEAAPGPGGVATAHLGDGLVVLVDVATGAVWEIALDEPRSSADDASRARARWESIVDGPPEEGAVVSLRADVAGDVTRLALLDRGARTAVGRGPASPWWWIEAESVRRRLDAPRVDDRVGPPLVGVPRLRFEDAVELDAAVDAMIDAGIVSVAREQVVSVDAARRALVAEQASAGVPAPGGSTVPVDPGFVRPGILDLRGGVRMHRDAAADVLEVTLPLQASYGAQLEGTELVAVDAGGIIAGADLTLVAGDEGQVWGQGRLVIRGDRSPAEVRVVPVAEGVRIPSMRLLALRDAARLTWAAGTAQRLGDADLSVRLRNRVVEVGGDRPGTAEAVLVPMLGEVADAALASEAWEASR